MRNFYVVFIVSLFMISGIHSTFAYEEPVNDNEITEEEKQRLISMNMEDKKFLTRNATNTIYKIEKSKTILNSGSTDFLIGGAYGWAQRSKLPSANIIITTKYFTISFNTGTIYTSNKYISRIGVFAPVKVVNYNLVGYTVMGHKISSKNMTTVLCADNQLSRRAIYRTDTSNNIFYLSGNTKISAYTLYKTNGKYVKGLAQSNKRSELYNG